MLSKTSAILLTICWLGLARSHTPEQSLDSVKGIRVASRIPCDGSTNFREEVSFQTSFSPGSWVRSFRLDEFEAQYCKHVDLYFVCLKRGQNRWKEAWTADSLQQAPSRRAWLNSCSTWGSGEVSQYLLSGWYREGGDRKLPWKQAAIKQVSTNPEIYEFTDPNSGTARLEIKRR